MPQVRDLYWTFRNFRNRVADFLRYRRVTANMDERFPDATGDDLARADGLCIICREDLGGAGGRAKRLPCNHVFHLHCLRYAHACDIGFTVTVAHRLACCPWASACPATMCFTCTACGARPRRPHLGF